MTSGEYPSRQVLSQCIGASPVAVTITEPWSCSVCDDCIVTWELLRHMLSCKASTCCEPDLLSALPPVPGSSQTKLDAGH